MYISMMAFTTLLRQLCFPITRVLGRLGIGQNSQCCAFLARPPKLPAGHLGPKIAWGLP